jgi:hypothetical protein
MFLAIISRTRRSDSRQIAGSIPFVLTAASNALAISVGTPVLLINTDGNTVVSS